jgi:regulator of sigma E protease
MDILVMAAQMILGLSFLVGLHELGHLLAAKSFGMRVEQYSIGFPPRIFKYKFGETVYSIGAIPLGGYVKIAGMLDESLDRKTMSQEPKPWEFRTKPAWQRMIVMMGGILMNILTGIIIFVIIVYSSGEKYIPKYEVNKYGIVAFEIAREIGLKTGDKILQINGHDYQKYWDLVKPDELLKKHASYTVDRQGRLLQIPIPVDLVERLFPSEGDQLDRYIFPNCTFVMGEITKDSEAEKAGLKKGDSIRSIDGQPTEFLDQFYVVLESKRGQTVNAEINREAQTFNIPLFIPENNNMGFNISHQLKFGQTDYSFAEAIPIGTKEAFSNVILTARSLGKIIKGDLDFSKSVSGPIGIAKTFGGQWDWYRFWKLVALLSMILAFMNFLPIPALDGGHVMFLSFEIISGRKPSDTFMETAQKIGMVLLLSLMIFIIFNDIIKLGS